MSLSVLSTQLSAPVEMCRIIRAPFFSPNTSADGFWYHSRATIMTGDLFGCMGNVLWAYPITQKSLFQAFRFRQYEDDWIERSVISYPPLDIDKDGAYDEKTYGNLFHNAYSILFDSFAPSGFVLPSNEREHFTRHSNFSGNLMTKSIRSPKWRTGLTIGYSSFDDVDRYYPVWSGLQVHSWSPFHVDYYDTLLSGWGSASPVDLIDFLDSFRSGQRSTFHGIGVASDGADTPCESVLTQLQYLIGADDSLEVTYHTACRNTQRPGSWEWDTRLYFKPHVFAPFVTPVLEEIYTLNGTQMDMTFTVYNYQCTSGGFRDTPTRFTDALSNNYSTAIPVSRPLTNLAGDFGKGWSNDIRDSNLLANIRSNFSDAITENWSHIIPSATFSTVDAIGKMEGSVNNNVLQTVVKIPDIVSALPRIGEAVRILGKLTARDLDGATLRDIFDLATSTHLQASFQWRPYYQLFTELWPKMALLLPSMLRDKHLTVGYGSFTFTINDDLGRERVTLVTRSKVVVDVTLSGLWSAGLTADALGLLPRLSRVWDLLPFTFVVNWFTGVGRILAGMESTGIQALAPSSYVHSYTLTSPFTEAELDALKASSTGSVPAGLKVYVRDKTHHPPFPRFSRFPFGVPTEFPSSGLIGSLLYQLFLS